MGHNIYTDSYSSPPQSRDLPRASQPVGRHWTSHHRWSAPCTNPGLHALMNTLCSSLFVFCLNSAVKRSIGSTTSCTITEKAPTRAFSWLKAGTTAFTFKRLLRHYAKLVIGREIGMPTQLS